MHLFIYYVVDVLFYFNQKLR